MADKKTDEKTAEIPDEALRTFYLIFSGSEGTRHAINSKTDVKKIILDRSPASLDEIELEVKGSTLEVHCFQKDYALCRSAMDDKLKALEGRRGVEARFKEEPYVPDSAKENKSDLDNKALQAQIRGLNQILRDTAEQRDTYKSLSEQVQGQLTKLQEDLETRVADQTRNAENRIEAKYKGQISSLEEDLASRTRSTDLLEKEKSELQDKNKELEAKVEALRTDRTGYILRVEEKLDIISGELYIFVSDAKDLSDQLQKVIDHMTRNSDNKLEIGEKKITVKGKKINLREYVQVLDQYVGKDGYSLLVPDNVKEKLQFILEEGQRILRHPQIYSQMLECAIDLFLITEADKLLNRSKDYHRIREHKIEAIKLEELRNTIAAIQPAYDLAIKRRNDKNSLAADDIVISAYSQYKTQLEMLERISIPALRSLQLNRLEVSYLVVSGLNNSIILPAFYSGIAREEEFLTGYFKAVAYETARSITEVKVPKSRWFSLGTGVFSAADDLKSRLSNDPEFQNANLHFKEIILRVN